MQTDEDARRIIAMGAKSSSVHVSKNLKYDVTVEQLPQPVFNALRMSYRIPLSGFVVTAASTHEGEEELVIKMYKKLLAEKRNLFLVLVPRHPERAGKVSEILRREGICFTMRSALDGQIAPFRQGEVLVVDTVGELKKISSISDVVFMGGSLVPVGGHNVVEPASFHVPVIFGPFMNNFKEIASLILKSGGGVQVADEAELADCVRTLFNDEGKRREMGRNGARFVLENSGSIERHMAIIDSFIQS